MKFIWVMLRLREGYFTPDQLTTRLRKGGKKTMIARLKIWQMHQQRKKTNDAYLKYISHATGDEREFRTQEAMTVRDEERNLILNFQSNFLLDEAEYLSIPTPLRSDENAWENGGAPGTIRLTLLAQSQLRQAVRNERKERWSVAAFMLKEIMAPFIGGLGALMGLLSVIHAFRSK